MPDDLDALFGADTPTPPAGFAHRVTTLAMTLPQYHAQPRGLRPWQWVSLATGAGFGTLMLGQFLLFAFVTTGAQ